MNVHDGEKIINDYKMGEAPGNIWIQEAIAIQIPMFHHVSCWKSPVNRHGNPFIPMSTGYTGWVSLQRYYNDLTATSNDGSKG